KTLFEASTRRITATLTFREGQKEVSIDVVEWFSVPQLGLQSADDASQDALNPSASSAAPSSGSSGSRGGSSGSAGSGSPGSSGRGPGAPGGGFGPPGGFGFGQVPPAPGRIH